MRTAALSLLIACTAFGQAPPAANASESSPVALVRFQVVPQKGKPVTGLRVEDIEVREDGKPRKVVVVQGGEAKLDIPLEISILFDCVRTDLSSGALDPKMIQEQVLNEFPTASVAVYGFSPGLNRLAQLTRSMPDLGKALDTPILVHPLSTFLMDHISRVMLDAGSTQGVALRILMVVSTGQTDQGTASASEQQQRYERAVGIAQRANISAFPVVLISRLATADASQQRTSGGGGGGSKGGMQTSSSELSSTTILRGVGNFGNLGPQTGGKKFEVLSGGNMFPTVLKSLAEELRGSYVAGFEVSMTAQSKPHKIEVVMRNKDAGRVTTPALTLVY
jgi:VWFA-related protein